MEIKASNEYLSEEFKKIDIERLEKNIEETKTKIREVY